MFAPRGHDPWPHSYQLSRWRLAKTRALERGIELAKHETVARFRSGLALGSWLCPAGKRRDIAHRYLAEGCHRRATRGGWSARPYVQVLYFAGGCFRRHWTSGCFAPATGAALVALPVWREGRDCGGPPEGPLCGLAGWLGLPEIKALR